MGEGDKYHCPGFLLHKEAAWTTQAHHIRGTAGSLREGASWSSYPNCQQLCPETPWHASMCNYTALKALSNTVPTYFMLEKYIFEMPSAVVVIWFWKARYSVLQLWSSKSLSKHQLIPTIAILEVFNENLRAQSLRCEKLAILTPKSWKSFYVISLVSCLELWWFQGSCGTAVKTQRWMLTEGILMVISRSRADVNVPQLPFSPPRALHQCGSHCSAPGSSLPGSDKYGCPAASYFLAKSWNILALEIHPALRSLSKKVV